jgi:hypothetical protein
MGGLRRLAVCAISAAAVMLSLGLPSASAAQAGTARPLGTGWTALTLENGWSGSAFGTAVPVAQVIDGIVHLAGGMATTGTNPGAFTLPAGFRPAAEIYVPVDMCGATNGRLDIDPSGEVTVEAGTNWSDAQCFTSLDGVSFALSDASFTALSLVNGWTGSPYGTAAPAAQVISGIVHLEGAMSTTGASPGAFTLPAGFRPAAEVYVPVDMCGATNGRLDIDPSGEVTVQAEASWADAQCFTSLDGVSFALSDASFTPLTLENVWFPSQAGTAAPAAQVISGIVHLEGAMYSPGTTDPVAFSLPAGFRPAANVYVPVDMCGATNGRLDIAPSGEVTVQAETSWSDAECFTSLGGVSFALGAL